jgi:hypothetical protein
MNEHNNTYIITLLLPALSCASKRCSKLLLPALVLRKQALQL